MRILIVYNAHRMGGGSDVVAARTAALLADAGHHVEVFTRSSKALAGLGGALRAGFSGVYAPITLRALDRVLETFRPDVVHAHEVYPLITPWIFPRAKRRGVATVMTCHDYRLSCPVASHFRDGRVCFECAGGHEVQCVRHGCAGSILKSIAYSARSVVARRRALFLNHVDLFLAPTESAKAILCRQAGLAPERVHVVGNPVSVEGREGRAEHRGSYVAYVGRLGPEKGFAMLARAWRELEVPLKVAGDALSTEMPLTLLPHVELVGPLDRDALMPFYASARFTLVPSLCHETFGMVVAESLACGTPVIVSDLGALAEVAGPGGVVVPAGDVCAWRRAIEALWNNEARCQTLSDAGRRHIARYSDQAYVRNVVAAYEALLHTRKGVAAI